MFQGLLRWSASQVRELYLKMGREVFNVADKGSLISQGHYYSPEPLERIFRELLGERLFSSFPPDEMTPYVCVLANEIDMLPAQVCEWRRLLILSS